MTVCRVQGKGHKVATLQTCHAFHCRENRTTDRFRNICYRHRNTFYCAALLSQILLIRFTAVKSSLASVTSQDSFSAFVTGRGAILIDAECVKSHHVTITHLTHSLFVTLPHLLFFSHFCQPGETVIARSRKYSK